jgi:hypothetical protein
MTSDLVEHGTRYGQEQHIGRKLDSREALQIHDSGEEEEKPDLENGSDNYGFGQKSSTLPNHFADSRPSRLTVRDQTAAGVIPEPVYVKGDTERVRTTIGNDFLLWHR